VDFQFPSVSNRVYTLEQRDSLLSGQWQEVDAYRFVPGTGTTVTYRKSAVLPLGGVPRFYRLRVDPLLQQSSAELVFFTFTEQTDTPDRVDARLASSTMTISSGSLVFNAANEDSWTGSGVFYAQGTSGFSATDAATAKNFSFTLSAQETPGFSVTNLSFLARATSAGPERVGVLINDVLVFEAPLPANQTTAFSAAVTNAVDLTQAVVRVAGWLDGSRGSSGGGQMHIDDVRLDGLVLSSRDLSSEVPVVTTPVSTEITEISARIGATISDNFSRTILERGIYWSTNATFALTNATQVAEPGEFGEGAFDLLVQNLPIGQTVHYVAYASSSAGTGYSEINSFATLSNVELAAYNFDLGSLTPTIERSVLTGQPAALSSGLTISTNWTAGDAAAWEALGGAIPYLERSGGWTATNAESAQAFEFVLDSDPGWLMTVTNLSFLARVTPAGPAAIGGIVNGELITQRNISDTDGVVEVNVPVPGGLAYTDVSQLTFRIAGWQNGSRTSSGGGAFRIDNVRIEGFMSVGVNTETPTVTNTVLAATAGDQAQVTATLLDNGGSTIVERGIYWSTTPGFVPPAEGIKVSEVNGSYPLGDFTMRLNQLPPDSTIYVVAFARNVVGEGYAAPFSFSTDPTAANVLAMYGFTDSQYTPQQRHPTLLATHLVSDDRKPAIVSSVTAFDATAPLAQITGRMDATTVADSRHYVFTLDSYSGATHTITNIRFLARTPEADGPSALSVTIDNGAPVFTTNMPVDQLITVNVPVTGEVAKALSQIRIHGWDNGSRSTAGSSALQIDEVVVLGSTSGSVIPSTTTGRRVRLASVNVQVGLDSNDRPNDLQALRATLERLDADVVTFQELRVGDSNAWVTLGQELGYTHFALAPNDYIDNSNPPGFYSRFPITDVAAVREPEGARELTRALFRVTVDVPDTDYPLVAWGVHLKASNEPADQFRRAVETLRLMADIEAYVASNPTHVAYAVLGDFNADVFAQPQAVSFSSLPAGLPSTYVLGNDVVSPVAYARFPDDRMVRGSLVLERAAMAQANGLAVYTFDGSGFLSSLDYVYLSPALAAMHPQGEIYNSALDGAYPGLPKAGDPLAPNISLDSSDHLPIFVDLYLTTNGVGGAGAPASTRVASDSVTDAGDSVMASSVPDAKASAGAAPLLSTDLSLLDRQAQLASTAAGTRLELIRQPDGAVWIRFPTAVGVVYHVEYRDGLAATESWQPLPNTPVVTGDGAHAVAVDPADPPPPSGLRLYRVRLE
jgi:endonuclease/exonuclease/phosphatase family metal-dependent hydrolase